MKLNDTELKVLIYIIQNEHEGIYGVDFKSIYSSMYKCKPRVRQIVLKLQHMGYIYEAMKKGYLKTYKSTTDGKEFVINLKEL